jgi:hypothetical protein
VHQPQLAAVDGAYVAVARWVGEKVAQAGHARMLLSGSGARMKAGRARCNTASPSLPASIARRGVERVPSQPTVVVAGGSRSVRHHPAIWPMPSRRARPGCRRRGVCGRGCAARHGGGAGERGVCATPGRHVAEGFPGLANGSAPPRWAGSPSV